MALRTVLAVALLIVAVAAPPAAAQLLGGLVNFLISGTVPCTPDATTITATTPVFPNATVLLQCGEKILASTVTNINGAFSILMGGGNPLAQLLSSLLGGCKLVVPTPLSACNSMMSSTGFLESPLQLISGNGLLGGILGGIFNIIPSVFKLVQ